MATIRTEKRQINKELSAIYELVLEDGDYSISCLEENRFGECTDFCCVHEVSQDEQFANAIYEKIVKNNVCACTLFDVINDLIC